MKLRLKILLSGLFISFLTLSPTRFVHANLIESISLAALGKSLAFIMYIAGYIASIAVQVTAFLVGWSLSLNSNIVKSHLVSVGWLITRDIANLGFVLAIILIAFFTIFRWQNYRSSVRHRRAPQARQQGANR